MCKGREYWSWTTVAFLVAVLVEVLLICSLETYQLVEDEPLTKSNTSVFVFGILVIALSIFLLYFGYNAVLIENVFELGALVFASLLVTGYTIDNFWYTASIQRTALTWFQFVSILALQPIILILALFVYWEFGWYTFKKVGADVELQARFQTFQIFVSVLKTDLMMGFFTVALAAVYTLGKLEAEVDSIALGVTVLWAILGYASARYEWTVGFVVFFVFSVCEPIYIGYKLVGYIKDPSAFDTSQRYISIVVVVAICAIVVRLALLILAVNVFFNLNHGLKDVLDGLKKKHRGNTEVDGENLLAPSETTPIAPRRK